MAAASSRARSSKVNISDLMRSAASRSRSSSVVMKRASVWRSKELKISAICSWLSRRLVWLSVDMNSVRSVVSIFSRISFCTGSSDSMRCTTSMASSSGRDGEDLAGVVGVDLGEHHGDGLRVLVLQIVGEHVFLHVGELLPHVAAGRAADLFHDGIDALGRQEGQQQALGGVGIARDVAVGGDRGDELDEQRSRACPG